MQNVKWGKFKIEDLFEIESNRRKFDANKTVINETGQFPYIVRTSINNGQKGFVNEDNKYLNDGNTIAFGQDTATMFYQDRPYFTGDKIKIIVPKDKRFSRNNALFFLTAMRKPFEYFSWGATSYSVDTIAKQSIVLPISSKDNIDFNFMNSFISELKNEYSKLLHNYLETNGYDNYELSTEEYEALFRFNNLRNIEWGTYKIGKLFEKIKTNKLPYKAKDLPKQPTKEYILPCLTSSFLNQGLNYFVPIAEATVLSNVISIPSNSDIYRAYYQSMDFTVLSDAYAIRWRSNKVNLSPNQYLFMVMCINKVTDLPIYSYKNKLGGWNVVKDKEIQLPQKNGEINFDLIELTISALKKLSIQKVVKYVTKHFETTKS